MSSPPTLTSRGWSPWAACGGLLILSSFFLFWNLGGGDLRPYDEGLYGKLARFALHHGQYLYPVDRDGAFTTQFSKPPLSIWAVAASFRALGPSLGALRFPFSLGALLGVLVAFAWGRRIGGNSMGLAWALLLLLSGSTLRWGRYASIEPLFCAFGLLALWSASGLYDPAPQLPILRRIGAGVGLTLAFMTKQVAVGVFVVPLLALELWRREGFRTAVSRLGVPFGIPLVVGVSWAAAAFHEVGQPFVDTYVTKTIVRRVTGFESGWNDRALNEIGGILNEVCAPGSWVLAGVGLVALGVHLHRNKAGPPGGDWLLPLFAVTACIVFENVSASMLPWYAFNFVPPLMAGLAWLIVAGLRFTYRPDPRDPLDLAVGAVGIVAILTVFIGALEPIASQLNALIVLAMLGVLVYRRRTVPPRILRFGAGGLLASVLVLHAWRQPELHRNPGPFAGFMADGVGADSEKIAVSARTGLNTELLYVTYFGPRAHKVETPPWNEPGNAEFGAFVTPTLVPLEVAPPKNHEFHRGPGATMILGTMDANPLSRQSLVAPLERAAGGTVTYEAEHLKVGELTRIEAERDASNGFAVGIQPFSREAILRFDLATARGLPLPRGAFTLRMRARWVCDHKKVMVSRMTISQQGKKLGDRAVKCRREGREGYVWTDLDFDARRGQIDVVLEYLRGGIWVDQIQIVRREVEGNDGSGPANAPPGG